MFYNQLLGDTGGSKTIRGSGTILRGSVLDFVAVVDCKGTVDAEVKLDNIAFFVFSPSSNSEPGCATSLLQNGDFDDDFTPWTTSQGPSNSASFTISGGQALVDFAANTASNDDPASISQTVTIPGANTPYRISADLVFTIGTGGCDVSFGTENQSLTFTGLISSSQRLPISFDDVSAISASEFIVAVSCTGSTRGMNSVGINSVALILNPGQECPTSSTSEVRTPMSTSFSSSSTSTESEVTSTPTPTAMCPSIPETPGVAATPECPDNDGKIYASSDGSQWLLVCGEDYARNNIDGTSVVASTLSDCIDLCMNRGTECVGVTFLDGYETCMLKFKMMPSGNNGPVLQSAIRIGLPGAASSSSQLLVKGDFTTDLSPWTLSSDSFTENSFVWRDGITNATLQINQPYNPNPSVIASLSQIISGAKSGDKYYLTAQVGVPGFLGYCTIEIRAGADYLIQRGAYYDTQPSCRRVDASGVFASDPTDLTLSYLCSNDGGDVVDTWASFDNLSLLLFAAPSKCTNSGKTYTSSDGSQWMIDCDEDYAGNDITCDPPTDELSTCIDQCMNYGPDCMGATWVLDNYRCCLKTRMQRTGPIAVGCYSFIRMSGPSTGPAAAQIVANGDFSTDLLPWYTQQQNNEGNDFVWNAGTAYIPLPFTTERVNRATLAQDITGVSAGQPYFLSAKTNFPMTNGVVCYALFSAGEEFLAFFAYGVEARNEPEYLSGYFTTTPGTLQIYVACENQENVIDTWMSIDDVNFSVWSLPTPSPEQLLMNNDFESGSYEPWESETHSSEVTLYVINGRATISYGIYGGWGYYHQYLTKPVESGQPVRIQADLYVDADDRDLTCTVYIYSDGDIWSMVFAGHQYYAIDLRPELPYGSRLFYMYAYCGGSGTVAFDNVYYTVNPGPNTEPPTSTATEVSSTSTSTSTSPTPTSPPIRQVIINNGFESGLDPWYTINYSDRTDLSIINGRAVMAFTRIQMAQWSLTAFEQIVRGVSTADVGLNVRFQADVYVDIPANTQTQCFVMIHSVDDVFWRTTANVVQTEHFVIDVQMILQYGAQVVTLYAGCYGTGTTTTIGWDNVYYTIDFTAPATSSTSASATPTPSVQPKPSCPDSDTQTYTNEDGSKYMIVCGQDYGGNDIVAINPVKAATFSICVDYCMYQGTACVGVSWAEPYTGCYLKYKMAPTAYPGFAVHSAIRVSGPLSGPSATQIIVNGGFTSDLSSWTTTEQTVAGESFTLNDGRAYISLPLSQSRDVEFGAYDYATLSQSIVGATAGQAYFLSVGVNLLGLVNQGYCNIQFSTDTQDLLTYNYGMSAQYGSVNGSGILKTAGNVLNLYMNCNDFSGSPADTWLSFDDIQLFVYSPSTGTNPILPVAAEGLVNNVFDNSFSPWTTDSTTGRMDFAIINGRATITYARIDNRYTSPSYIMQVLNKPTQEGQNVRIQADVWINVSAGTKCVAQVWGGYPVAWTSPEISTSQYYHVDVSQTLTSGSQWFYLYGSCTGTGTATNIQFDNVYLTLNAF